MNRRAVVRSANRMSVEGPCSRCEYSTSSKGFRLYDWRWAFVFSGLSWLRIVGSIRLASIASPTGPRRREGRPAQADLGLKLGCSVVRSRNGTCGPRRFQISDLRVFGQLTRRGLTRIYPWTWYVTLGESAR